MDKKGGPMDGGSTDGCLVRITENFWGRRRRSGRSEDRVERDFPLPKIYNMAGHVVGEGGRSGRRRVH